MTDFPAFRSVLGDAHEAFDDDAIESAIESSFPNADPMDVENFMSSLQSFARTAAPIAQSALGGAVQGAMMGGPVGAVIGGLGGGASAALSGGQRPAAPPSPPSPPRGPPPMAPALPASIDPNIAQLLMLLSRPETVQALLAMLVAPNAQQPVRVGDRQVPAPAFANALAELAGIAAEASDATPSEDIDSYLVDDNGTPRCDAFNPFERAVLLVSDLANADTDEAYDDDDEEESEALAFDPLDAYEAALEGRTFDD